MATNKSKKRSPRSWHKWLMSGAIAGVHHTSLVEGFGTIRFDRPIRFREVIKFHKKCGIRLMTLKDLENFMKILQSPEPIARPEPSEAPPESWTDAIVSAGNFGRRKLGPLTDWSLGARFLSFPRD